MQTSTAVKAIISPFIPFLFILSTLFALTCGPARSTAAYCDPSAKMSACDGKTVLVVAEEEAPMMQHPRLSMDKQESYWMVKGSVWIFVSDAQIECRSRVEAIGTLKAKVGPCDPTASNKNMYCGTALFVQSFRCLP
ncbi:MAG: hypothetical protein JNM27_23375 [Leptospirales bacterium]|nr:hypothetical protein [Leptospirales bacterium]